MSTEQISDFFDGYEDARMGGPRVPDGKYHLIVTENLGEPDWSTADRPVVEVACAVASGEYEDVKVPRLRLQLGEFSYTIKRGRHAGETRTVPTQEVLENLRGLVRTIHGPTPPPVPTNLQGAELLDALADAILGDEFFATVTLNEATGFQDMRGYRSIDDPPKGFVSAKDLDEFKV